MDTHPDPNSDPNAPWFKEVPQKRTSRRPVIFCWILLGTITLFISAVVVVMIREAFKNLAELVTTFF